MSASLHTPTLAGFTAWARVRLPVDRQQLPDNSPWLSNAFDVSIELVNQTLRLVSPFVYELAVYNLAASLLINFAPDQPGNSFFAGLRSDMRLGQFVPGVVASTADASTSTSLLNPDFMHTLTLDDLQRVKDPFGRQYLQFAQLYGDIWGLT